MPATSKPNSSGQGKIEEFQKDGTERAANIIQEKFPLRIQKLQSLIKSELWQIRSYDAIVAQLPAVDKLVHSSQAKITFGVQPLETIKTPDSYSNNMGSIETTPTFSSNPKILAVSEELKPMLRDFIEDCIVLKLWMTLLIPKIEDGNNFGVGVQEKIIQEINYAKSDATRYYGSICGNVTSRSKLCSKVIKYPQIEDYRNAINEQDERQFSYLTKAVTTQFLNLHVVLMDMISKNQEKIEHPRGTGKTCMYGG